MQYTPTKCFNNFVQSAVDARREGDENPNSSFVAETMKLLANISYGYQIMDRSRDTIIKYIIDEKTQGAINKILFTRLGFINDQLYEVEPVKSEIQHKEATIVGFVILQLAKLRLLELYYNFFDKYCEVTKLEMDTDSHFLALSEHNSYDCIQPAMKKELNSLRRGYCTDKISANSKRNLFPCVCCAEHKRHDRREPGLFKEEFRSTEMICLCRETFFCYDSQSNKFKFSSDGLKKKKA